MVTIDTSGFDIKYVCECGKEFDNPQSFNGHKSQCKAHYAKKYGEDGERVLMQRFVNQKERLMRGFKRFSSQRKEQIVNREYSWSSEKHTCETCGKIMTEKFGSGRFCCRACANTRQHSESEKQKIRESLSGKKKNKERIDLPIEHRFCYLCGKEISTKSKTCLCARCLHGTDTGKLLLKGLSRAGIEKAISNGVDCGWRKRSKNSYAELFWMNVLDNNGIEYEREFRVKKPKGFCYFLDFKIVKNEFVIDLEIDGEQHIHRAERDKERDNLLKSLGYTVYRVEWNEINSEAGKRRMEEKIGHFLDFYNKV